MRLSFDIVAVKFHSPVSSSPSPRQPRRLKFRWLSSSSACPPFLEFADLDIQTMLEEAYSRWLRPNEIHALLCNHKYFTINVKPVLLIGGSTGTMLEALEVVGDSHDTSLGDGFEVVNNRFMTSYDDEDSPSGSGFRTKLREFHKSTASFTELDRNFLTPFFTSNNGDYDDEGNTEQHHEERIPFTRRGNFNNRG